MPLTLEIISVVSIVFGCCIFCCILFRQTIVVEVFLCKGDANYGRPVAGSKTELRGKQAGVHISSEVIELCNIVRMLGVPQHDGSYAVTFGDLFEFYTRISNKVGHLSMLNVKSMGQTMCDDGRLMTDLVLSSNSSLMLGFWNASQISG